MSATPTRRLSALDSLRGIAALLVVLFHYTTRYDELFGHRQAPVFTLPWGHLGVNLFFMISGFVIFMTLARTRRPRDFLVSRFSRLYPAYWCAVILTFALTHWMGLPDKLVNLPTALANLTMLHSFAAIPSVDGVYWTLEVELLFYAWALLAYRLRLLGQVHLLLLALFAVRLGYFASAHLLHIDLPWIAYRLLIINAIPWFAAGIMVYRRVQAGAGARRDWGTLLAAIAVVAIVDGPFMAALMVALSAILYYAARDELPVLGHPVLAYLGTISYTLYLLHENIGWALIRRLEAAGVDSNLAIALALALALALASALTRWVEQPALRAIRRRYAARSGLATLAGTPQP